MYEQEDGTTRRKANCDVEMAFYLIKEKDNFDRVIILSGDGDFLPILEAFKRKWQGGDYFGKGSEDGARNQTICGGQFQGF